MADNNQETGGEAGFGSSTRREALATFGTAAGVVLGATGLGSAQSDSAAAVSVDPDPPTVGAKTTFTGSGASVAKWHWFVTGPDGATTSDTGQSTAVTFEQTGSYRAVLYVKLHDGDVQTVVENGWVEGSDGDVVARVERSPKEPVSNLITFDASGSSASDGEITDYEWYRKEGEPDSDDRFVLQTTGETYADTFEPGTTWSVKLEVRDATGDTATETVTFRYADSDPVAWIDYSPQDPGSGPVTFDASGSSTPDGEIAGYEWYRKEGEPDSDDRFTLHATGETYADSFEPGTTWTVKVEVRNSAGNTDTEAVSFTPAE